MNCIARINEASDDRPSRVDVTGEGALAWACARARGVKRGEAAVLVQHEAVTHIARVKLYRQAVTVYRFAPGTR